MLYQKRLVKPQLRQALSRTADLAGLAGLTLLAGLLPFELRTPILTPGPLSITNTEFVLYLTVALWIASRIARRSMRWTPVHAAVLAWTVALLLSAIFALSHRDVALKFVLRSWGGCALFFAASDWIGTPRRAMPVALALIAGTCLSALTALAEVWLPGAASALLAFKTQASLAGSYVRASGSFQYANIAAMYWEAVLPLVLGFGFLRILSGRHFQASRWIAVAVTLVLIEAIVLSASRAALIVVALVLIALTWITRRTFPAMRVAAAISLMSLVTLALINLAASPLLALRLRTASDAEWYQADYDPGPASGLRIEAGQMVTLSVRVRNEGALTWSAFGENPVFLSYHWRDPASDQTIVFNGLRTALTEDVPPEAEATLAARVVAPSRPGRYILEWDMVHENVIWFSAKGDDTSDMTVQVTPATSGDPQPPLPPAIDRLIQSSPARLDLWRAGLRMWLEAPLLGVGPDNFRHLYGPYLGLKPFDNRIHTNNLYIEMLVNLGLLGLLAFTALIVTLTQTAWLGWRRLRSQEARALTLGVLAGLTAFFAHGLFDYFFEFTATYGLFWLLAGTAVGLLTGEIRA